MLRIRAFFFSSYTFCLCTNLFEFEFRTYLFCRLNVDFSGRDGIHTNETLWASWVIKSANHNVYFSGDSGYDTHFKIIGDKYGPFDVAFLDSGQYNKKWREVHMFPHEAMKAAQDLRAKYHFPVHWGMFELALHDWDAPVRRLTELSDAQSVPLLTPQLGEVVRVPGNTPQKPWWQQLP